MDLTMEIHGFRSGFTNWQLLLTGKHLTSILLAIGVVLKSSYIKISVSANSCVMSLSLNTTEIFSSHQCRFEVIGFSSTETSPCSLLSNMTNMLH